MQADAERLGARVRKGITYGTLEQDADGVTASFTDGATGRYDLVVAADGVPEVASRASSMPSLTLTVAPSRCA